MIETTETWKAPKEVALKIINLALAHIREVELNPEVKTEGDNFDYWNSYDLGDGNYVDYNIHCGDEWCVVKQDGSGEYEYTDPSTWSWDVCAYAVDPPKEEGGYHQIDTDREHYLFNYNKKGNREVNLEDKL